MMTMMMMMMMMMMTITYDEHPITPILFMSLFINFS